MQEVVTVELNGRSFQLDQGAYDALRGCRARMELRLGDHPNRAEILVAFEETIAQKCDLRVGTFKLAVSAAEMAKIVREMELITGAAQTSSTRSSAGSKEAVVSRRRWWGGKRRDSVGRAEPARPTQPPAGPPPAPRPPTELLGAVLLVPICGVISIGLLLGMALAVASLLDTGAIYGWTLPGVPIWAGVLLLVVLFVAAMSRVLNLRQLSYSTWSPSRWSYSTWSYSEWGRAWVVLWDALFVLAFMATLFWLATQYMPQVNNNLDQVTRQVVDVFNGWASTLGTWINHIVDAL
jgi:hypothetical protein